MRNASSLWLFVADAISVEYHSVEALLEAAGVTIPEWFASGQEPCQSAVGCTEMATFGPLTIGESAGGYFQLRAHKKCPNGHTKHRFIARLYKTETEPRWYTMGNDALGKQIRSAKPYVGLAPTKEVCTYCDTRWVAMGEAFCKPCLKDLGISA